MKYLEKLTKKNLEELLVDKGIIDAIKLRELSIQSTRRNIPIEKTLTPHGLLDDEKLAEVTSKTLGLPFFRLHNLEISEELVRRIPSVLMKKFLFFPMIESGGSLTLAVTSPPTNEMITELQKTKSGELFFFVSLLSDIENHINKFSQNTPTNTPENKPKSGAQQAGTTDVWETIFDKVDNEIMSEIVKTQQRKTSPLQGTQLRDESPLGNDINTALSSVFPEDAPQQVNNEIDSALSAVFGEEEPQGSSGEINSALSAVFGEEEPQGSNGEIDSALSAVFGEEEPPSEVQNEIDSALSLFDDNAAASPPPDTKRKMSQLALQIEQNPLDRNAISQYAELAISIGKISDATDKLAAFARTMIKSRDFDEAKRCYEAILALDPTHEEAKNYLS